MWVIGKLAQIYELSPAQIAVCAKNRVSHQEVDNTSTSSSHIKALSDALVCAPTPSDTLAKFLDTFDPTLLSSIVPDQVRRILLDEWARKIELLRGPRTCARLANTLGKSSSFCILIITSFFLCRAQCHKMAMATTNSMPLHS